jgi:branched-chain amino acid transport system substrate-binding protein
MDRVNSLGGIQVGDKKHLVDLVFYDDASDAETAVKLTEKLITDDEVSFLFGPFGSGTTNATSAVGEKYQVLTMASMANANSITNAGSAHPAFCLLPGLRHARGWNWPKPRG